MPDISVSYQVAQMSRRYPQVHRLLKAVKNFFTQTVREKWLDLLRIFAPVDNFRLGPPKGLFSIYTSLLFENRRPGRVVLTDQGAPALTETSLMPRSGHHHHVAQPWPI